MSMPFRVGDMASDVTSTLPAGGRSIVGGRTTFTGPSTDYARTSSLAVDGLSALVIPWLPEVN